MKNFFISLFVILSIQSVAQDATYGEKIDKTGAIEIQKAIDQNKDSTLKLKGEILTTCANKGCWMTMKVNDDQEIRVTFKDYGFFVPTEGVEGKTAIVQGELKKEVTDVETLKHFAEDAGKTEEEIAMITEPKEEYSFVASGVIIEN